MVVKRSLKGQVSWLCEWRTKDDIKIKAEIYICCFSLFFKYIFVKDVVFSFPYTFAVFTFPCLLFLPYAFCLVTQMRRGGVLRQIDWLELHSTDLNKDGDQFISELKFSNFIRK